MKNKKLFKSLTTSALILTSAMAFSSSAFADPVEFKNGEATITNYNLTKLTFTKVFKNSNSSSTWAERKAADPKLAAFTDFTQFNQKFKLVRNNSDSDTPLNPARGNTIDEQKADVLNDAKYIVTVKTAPADEAKNDISIVYEILVDGYDDTNKQSYTFKISEYTDATTDYESSHSADEAAPENGNW